MSKVEIRTANLIYFWYPEKKKKEVSGMDTRNEILTNVLAVMSSIITGVALDQLQSVLVSELAKYEVQERFTEKVGKNVPYI